MFGSRFRLFRCCFLTADCINSSCSCLLASVRHIYWTGSARWTRSSIEIYLEMFKNTAAIPSFLLRNLVKNSRLSNQTDLVLQLFKCGVEEKSVQIVTELHKATRSLPVARRNETPSKNSNFIQRKLLRTSRIPNLTLPRTSEVGNYRTRYWKP